MYEKEFQKAVETGVDICHLIVKSFFDFVEFAQKYYKEEKRKMEGYVWDERVKREIKVIN